MAYSHICYGVTQLSSSSSSSSYDILSKWFTSGDYKHYMTQIGLIVVGVGLLSILTTNLPCRRNIKLALKLFGLTEHNMGFDLRDKVFRLNKRNKIAVLIILCVAGVGIYIIFKRLILAIFHKSFKYSKR
nr:hypothetical protein [Candidatus Mycoplasma haematolamae]